MAPRESVSGARAGAGAASAATNVVLSTEREEVVAEKQSSTKHPHAQRRTEILAAHPGVSKLFGRDRGSALYTAALVVGQFVLSAGVAYMNLPWYAWMPTAYFVGSLVDHALWVLIHDGTHNLVFEKVWANRILIICANLPHVFPSAIMFRYFHIQHHIELNKINKDPDVPAEWEARMVGNSSFMKALWLAFFFLFQTVRIMFYTYKVPRGQELLWIAANWIASLLVNGAITYFFGWKALTFLLLASMSAIGLHPVGARWIQEHYPTQPFQSTYSYYGPINKVAFNIGFHNEHHDFPSVPWSKLPVLKKLAPEYYTTLFAYNSYSELLYDFIFERRWSLLVRFEMEQKNQ